MGDDDNLPLARRRDLNVLLTLLAQQLPLTRGVLTTVQILRLVCDFLSTNRKRVLAILAAGTGVAVLVPAILSVIGFTSSGVLAGSLAALIQSVFYGANTGGIFSLFQSIGATAALAPPVAFVLGGAALIGAGWLWWYGGGSTAQVTGGNDDDDDGGGCSGSNGGGAGGGDKRGDEDAGDDKGPAPEAMALVKPVRMRTSLTNSRISAQIASLFYTLSTTDDKEEEEEKGKGEQGK